MPRLSEIQAWDTEHLTAAAQWWEATATRWEDGFAEVVRHSFTPGGSVWEGSAATAAQERALCRPHAGEPPSPSTFVRRRRMRAQAPKHSALGATAGAVRGGRDPRSGLPRARRPHRHLRRRRVAAASAAGRAQAASMARDIWHVRRQLAATDRRCGASHNGVVQRVFTSLIVRTRSGGPQVDAPPNDLLGVRNAEDVHDDRRSAPTR